MKSNLLSVLRVVALGICAVGIVFSESCMADGSIDSLTPVYTNCPAYINSLAYGNGSFVGVGGGFKYLSHDGSNWTVYANSPNLNPATVAFGSGEFLMYGTDTLTGQPRIFLSTDGQNWMPLLYGNDANPALIYTNATYFTAAASAGNGTWVLISPNKILTATIGIQETALAPIPHAVISITQEFQPSFSPYCITFANGIFVLGANYNGKGTFFTSSDGITWLYKSVLPLGAGDGSPIVFGDNKYVTTGVSFDGGGVLIYSSSNLLTWNSAKTLNYYQHNYLLPLVYAGGKFLFSTCEDVFGNSHSYASTDGLVWDSVWMNHPTHPIFAMTFGQGKLMAADQNSIYQTDVLAAQSNQPPTTLSLSTYAGVTITGTAGAVYQIQYTTNLNAPWIALTNFYLPYSPFIWVDTTAPVAGKRFYQSVQVQ